MSDPGLYKITKKKKDGQAQFCDANCTLLTKRDAWSINYAGMNITLYCVGHTACELREPKAAMAFNWMSKSFELSKDPYLNYQ